MDNPSPPIVLRNILVATDFSSASQTAALYGIAIARRYDAMLYLVHMVGAELLALSGTDSNRALDDAWREGQRLTIDLLVAGQLRGVKNTLLVERGEIWDGLAPVVAKNKIDMIVVGTRGRTGLAKMFIGSVAERIFRN